MTPPREPMTNTNTTVSVYGIRAKSYMEGCGRGGVGVVGSCVRGEGKGGKGGRIVPVRPKTLVTLTSLTGTLPESIFARVVFPQERE